MRKSILAGFARNEDASIHVEYGMIALLIGVLVLATVDSIGVNMKERYNAIASALSMGERDR